MLEIETKIIDFDERSLRESLKRNRAKLIGKYFYKRWVFDLSKKKGVDKYIRIRTNGKKTTLTYKFRKGSGLKSTEELETEISDAKTAVELFSKLIPKHHYQESKRELYKLGGAELSINRWPGIKPILEIEAKSTAEVNRIVKLLDINGRNIGNISATKVYRLYGKNIRAYSRFKS